MIGTDRYSYLSRLKEIDPTAKLAMSAVSVVLCLCMGGLTVGLFTVVFFSVLTAVRGGVAARTFLRLMRAPFFFLLIGTLTILLGRFPPGTELLVGVTAGAHVYGVTRASLYAGAQLIVHAMGCIASVYFTVLSTPVTDLLLALRRMHVPQLMLELMELIYRFIFVLYESMQRIHTAQASRLGYEGLRRSYRSLGELIGTVFLKAYRKSDRIYVALEARGYDGVLCTLPQPYQSGRTVYGWCAALTLCQFALFFAERGLAAQ